MRGSMKLGLAGLLGTLACGCATGTGAPPAPPPAIPVPAASLAVPESDESSLGALEHDLEVAAGRLEEELARKRRRLEAPTDEAPSLPPPAAAEPKKKEPARQEARPDAEPPHGYTGAPCDIACRALHSMRGSVRGICALTSEAHPRCRRAVARVADAERRIAEAACACIAPRPEQLSRAGPTRRRRGRA
jgi:hypothetical protein